MTRERRELSPFHGGMRVRLVERVDHPGRLGAAMDGGRFVCPLPDGYDADSSITYERGWVIVAHPSLPPLSCNTNDGTVNVMNADLIKAQAGRILLAR